MKLLRVLVTSLVLLGLLAPMAMAHPKPDAAHIPHEIMPDDAAWAAAFGGTTFADLWEDLEAAPWGKVMELPSGRNWRGGSWNGTGDARFWAVPIGFNFKFMQGPATGVPSYVFDPTCGKMYPEGYGPGCYIAYKWSWKLRDEGYNATLVHDNGFIFFPDVTYRPIDLDGDGDPDIFRPEVLTDDTNWLHQDFSREPPNNFIAPFWSDWYFGSNDYYDAGIAFDANDLPFRHDDGTPVFWDNGWVRRPRGRLLYATLGEAPNRTFVVEWLNGRDIYTGFLATFELQLFEGSNAILFLYKEFVGKPGNPDFFIAAHPVLIGLEDLFGVTYVGDLYTPEWERMPSPVANESVRGFVY
jgi:hypothetical protein